MNTPYPSLPVPPAATVAILDACVLYPATLRDFLIQIAASSIYRARLTDAIHEEWIRNLLRDYPNLTAANLARTRERINEAVPEIRVTGYESRIDSLTLPDPNDRHVLAAAIHARASVIVTFNGKDFPAATLTPYGIIAQSPDAFVMDQMTHEGKRQEVIASVQRVRLRLCNPPKTVEEYLDGLRKNRLTRTADALMPYSDAL